MNTERLAEVMDRFAATIADLAEEIRDGGGQDAADAGQEVEFNDGPAAAPAKADGPDASGLVQVSYGDLWKLVNRSRKMIRLAREGKVPSMEARAPLCRAIKAIKAQGVNKKPHNHRD